MDQFEELFTLCPDDQQRRTFIESLSQLASPPHSVALVVVGVRADFYAACADYSPLRAALQDNQLMVGPMSDTELRAAIRYPAQDVGLDVEEGLIDLLLRDLGDTAGETTGYEAGRLPLLAHALRATWQQRHGHTLTVDGYRTTGGIHRAWRPRPTGSSTPRSTTGHTRFVYAVAFSPDGRTLASGSADKTVRLWNIPAALLSGHNHYVFSVAFSPWVAGTGIVVVLALVTTAGRGRGSQEEMPQEPHSPAVDASCRAVQAAARAWVRSW